jgi:large subunit ribosomal protein L24
MKIKKGDTVKILIGKDKGKTGKVLKILPSSKGKDQTKLIVENMNLRYKHIRPKKGGEKGQRIKFPFAMFCSDVSIVCPKCGKSGRVGFKVLAKAPETSREKKQRICKKCNTVI